ncbi:MAG: lytic transglycosylase domain-containing protein, partial [Candidatus Limnocylindria bacterium]
LDGDSEWDRAMGPLQFIPTTWRELGRDGNGDGSADPDNLYDAALTAVAHLCLREPGDYASRSELRRALIAYNASGQYADDVLRWVDRYRTEAIDDILETPAGES